VNGFDSDSAQSVRKLATDILVSVDTRKSYADILLDETLKNQPLCCRDRGLLTELVYGTLRWRGRIDAHLKTRLRRSLDNTSPYLRNLLRLALYQLMFLDRVPHYAAVNEAVALAKAAGGQKAAGFVNALLRDYLRDEKASLKPDSQRTSIAALAEYWSHPEWLVKRWTDYFGRQESEALFEVNNNPAPLVLRVNTLKATRAELLQLLADRGIEAAPTEYAPHGLTVYSRLPVYRLPGFEIGWFQVQGEASQLVSYLLAPERGERILDACAAPGGKTTHIAELTADDAEIIAVDQSAPGIRKLEQNVSRLNLESIHAVHGDVRDMVVAGSGLYDRMLIDAPCSGLGTLRSHPEIKWHRGEGDVKRLSRLQESILTTSVSSLKKGGVVVYATCTLSPDENEKMVEGFLENQKGFVLEEAAKYLPGRAKELVRGNYFLALPHRHNTDGFFAARMRRVD
jgi:16S rRNA (cytosine967-C5)-methyltransferase